MKAVIILRFSPQEPFPWWAVKLEKEEKDFGNRSDSWDRVVDFLIEKGVKSSEIEFFYENGEPGRKDFENIFRYSYERIYKKTQLS